MFRIIIIMKIDKNAKLIFKAQALERTIAAQPHAPPIQNR